MLKSAFGYFRRGSIHRQSSSLSGRLLSTVQDVLPGAGIAPSERPAYQTHEIPVYTLPYYGATEQAIAAVSDRDVSRALKVYGGLMRKQDTLEERRERLFRLSRDRLTITGLVVSDKMDKSVVVAARRRAFAKKLRKEYAVTRRFMAHDEEDLCREGDKVVIRSCRPMSRWKSHVVVRNYGDKTRVGADERARKLEDAIAARDVPVPEN